MPALDIFLHFKIWNNELCLSKVTVHSELKFYFFFLAVFHLLHQRHGASSFMMSISLDKKLMWIKVDLFYVWLRMEKRMGKIIQYLDGSEKLENKAIQGSLGIAIWVRNICYMWTVYLINYNSRYNDFMASFCNRCKYTAVLSKLFSWR